MRNTTRTPLSDRGVRMHATARPRALRRLTEGLAPYALALPALALMALFVYGVGIGVLQGFGIAPFLDRFDFTLEYFREAFTRSDFTSSLCFSLFVSLMSSLIALGGGILLSAALVKAKSGSFTQLLGLQIPIMSMHALVALGFIFLLSGSGLLARVLYVVGIVGSPNDLPSIVGAPSGWGIILVYAWKEIPYVAFCTITIMSHVSDSLGEAAATCGAAPVRSFFSVTLPLSLTASLKAFLVVFAFSFGAYEIPFLLGPTAPKALPILAYLEFQDPDILNRFYAMAINGIVTLVCALAALVYFLVLKHERKEGGR
ncbi:ABC transporter permease [Adlercreutzia sp. ZJ141]|uniref:ABC transporter permease n=1 Tax=Adlercreutzia sp. ZJ141 TaxID=2709406 RepID=UPI0013ED5C7C|nr:ABC transporter permease subunit [Adlercreutzia sp. ZJ141]